MNARRTIRTENSKKTVKEKHVDSERKMAALRDFVLLRVALVRKSIQAPLSSFLCEWPSGALL